MFVLLVQAREVALVDIHLVIAGAPLDLRHQSRDARPQIYQHVGTGYEIGRQVEDLHVGGEVARGHKPHLVQIGGEDVGILVNGAILKDIGVACRQHIQRLLNTAAEKRYLKLERPTAHVVIEIADIRVIGLLEIGFGPVMSGQNIGKGRLAAPDIACNSYIHGSLSLVGAIA